MNGRTRRADDVSGECSLGECGFCHGNVALQVGPGPAVPLLRCQHSCHRGQPVRLAAHPTSGHDMHNR